MGENRSGFDRLEDRGAEAADRLAGRLADHPKRTVGKWVAVLVAAVIGITILASVISTGSLFFEAKVAKVTAQPRVTKQIYGTENIISQVKLFHDKCTGVQEKLAVFKNNYARYASMKEAARLQTDPLAQHAAIEGLVPAQQDVTAALNAAQADVRDYNSASANPTVAPFKTIFAQHGLPNRIELPAGEAAANSFTLSCG